MSSGLTRRTWLAHAALGVGTLAAAARAGQQEGRIPTPRQTQGPFYPVQDQPDKDLDLTRLEGAAASAMGTVVLLDGAVRTLDGAPIAGALVEIWQACASGRYNHPRDRNPALLDPNFQYWGRVTTDATGRYGFKTIKPGAYPNDPDWVRPPHIHFRVVAPGFPALTTQMYFEGEDLNLRDRILLDLTPAERKLVTRVFEPVRGQAGDLAGRFDIILGRRGTDGATPELD